MEVMDLLPVYMSASVVFVVFLSEVTKAIFKLLKVSTRLKGFWFILPLFFSFLVVLIQHISDSGLTWNQFVADVVKVYGVSTLAYEAVAKRIFGLLEDNHEDNIELTRSDSDADLLFDSSLEEDDDQEWEDNSADD